MEVDTLDHQTTLITVNRRLSRVLRAEHDRARLAAGAVVWESPDILPYSAWLERCWHGLAAASDAPLAALLGPDQALSLWEQVIERRPPADAGPALLQSGQAARSAQAAWALLHAWQLSHDDDLGFLNDEARVFRGWARDYAALCADGHWLDETGIADALIDSARQARADGGTLPGLRHASGQPLKGLLLAGFDSLTPQQRALFDGLAASGIQVREQPAARHPMGALRLDFATLDEELEAAARWARQRLEQDDRAAIGIVVPELAAQRPRVTALFGATFAPGAARPGAAPAGVLFNISLGQALSEVPVAADALLGLRAMQGSLGQAEAGHWLLSPYLGADALFPRARLDAELRRIGEPRYALTRLAELAARLPGAGQLHRDATPIFAGAQAELFRLLARSAPSRSRRQAVSQWAAQFSDWLVLAGWPGERGLESSEYQAVQAVHELLASLAALAAVMPPVDLSAALAQLERLAAGRLFQPRTGGAPVQILGVLEAAGADFTHLWITGLHHQAWPQPARPNPFLPIGLQRRLGMPRCDSAHQLRWARDWTTRMLHSAPQVVVSHPRQQGDEPLRPSALIAGVPAGRADALRPAGGSRDAQTVHESAPSLETLHDEQAPPVDTLRPVRGGVSIFKDQAACPFRAFGVHRLGARDVAAPDSSLDPRVRGTLAHRLLEDVWQSLGGQTRLLALTAAERRELVRDSAHRVLLDESRRRPHTLRGRLLDLEHKRLQVLAEAWLDIEIQRPPFDVAAEQSETRSVEGLPVTLRPDRVDRMAGDDLLLVDYKTGAANPRDWFGERPDEPQLPVYALAMDDAGGGRVAGIAFAVLRPGELGYRGLGAHEDMAPGIAGVADGKLRAAREAPDWESHKALWRKRLGALARAYLQGDARVDPKSGNATCRYCGLQALCRVHEQ